ncbi:hypothetical protein CLOM_g23020 [Closterium sp. NIES-68]|nr:hypothetical protein CLOM_g23020 [Closterium sp. NIES-68]
MSQPRARSAAISPHAPSATSSHTPSATPLELRREFLRRAAESLAVSSPPVAAHLGRCLQLLTPATQGQTEGGGGGRGGGVGCGEGGGPSVSKAMAVDGSVLCAGCGLPQILPSTCSVTIASYPRAGKSKRRRSAARGAKSGISCRARGAAMDDAATSAHAARAATPVEGRQKSSSSNEAAGTAAVAPAPSSAAAAAAAAAAGTAAAALDGLAKGQTGERRKGSRKRQRKARGGGQARRGGEEHEKRRRVGREGVQGGEGKAGAEGKEEAAVGNGLHRNRVISMCRFCARERRCKGSRQGYVKGKAAQVKMAT